MASRAKAVITKILTFKTNYTKNGFFLPFGDTKSLLTTIPYKFDNKCQCNSKNYELHILLSQFGMVRFFSFFLLWKFFSNKREFSSTDWLDPFLNPPLCTAGWFANPNPKKIIPLGNFRPYLSLNSKAIFETPGSSCVFISFAQFPHHKIGILFDSSNISTLSYITSR